MKLYGRAKQGKKGSWWATLKDEEGNSYMLDVTPGHKSEAAALDRLVTIRDAQWVIDRRSGMKHRVIHLMDAIGYSLLLTAVVIAVMLFLLACSPPEPTPTPPPEYTPLVEVPNTSIKIAVLPEEVCVEMPGFQRGTAYPLSDQYLFGGSTSWEEDGCKRLEPGQWDLRFIPDGGTSQTTITRPFTVPEK